MKSGMDRSIRGFNMKKRILLSASFLILIFLSGCFHSEEKGNELIDYYNGWLLIRDTSPSLSSMLALGRTDSYEETKRLLSEEILPVFQESLDYLEEIELEFKEIRELHELHVKTEEIFFDFFQEYESQLEETGLHFQLEWTDEEQAEIDQLAEEFHDKREKLMEKYDVYWITDYDDYGNKLDRMGKHR